MTEVTLSKILVNEIIEELELYAEELALDGCTAYSSDILDLVERINRTVSND